jgi:serine/threonine-protein kinase
VGGFLLFGHIGEGEMGSVYRAMDESLNRAVAVKLVRGCHAEDPDSVERLRREARAAGSLNHPHVAQVYALNFSNGHPYLVMELVTGQDFAQKLESEGRIDERTALKMALDVADGLSALNREGLVHGDIKPGNIVLDRDGNAKLVDFGLSGMARHKDGALVGTPNYIAPELLRGSPDSHLSDIYSLGATLYHLLSGRPPADGEKTIDVLRARLFRRPTPLAEHAKYISMPTRKLVMQMLDPEPARRPSDSDAVAGEIRKALAQLDVPQPVTPGLANASNSLLPRVGVPLPPQRVTLYSRSRPYVVLVLVLIAAVELVIAVREESFARTSEWFSEALARRAKRLQAEAASRDPAETGAPAPDDFGQSAVLTPVGDRPQQQLVAAPSDEGAIVMGTGQVWQSVNLGQNTQRGSTMHMGGTLIIQGAGTAMWQGHDRCRFVWTKASSNYVFCAQVKAIAENNSLDITGLLVKGDDFATGPGLLYGYLGSGHVFLQIREPNNTTVLVKRSERPIPLPRHLKLTRCGHVFEASFSADGSTWLPFGSCELALSHKNTVGFSVSAQDTNALATAKFATISVQSPGQPNPEKPGSAPGDAKKPVTATHKK